MTSPPTSFVTIRVALNLATILFSNEKSKHFEIDYHYTRQKVENNSIRVEYISSREQPANLLTKSLGRTKFEECREKLHLLSHISHSPLSV